MTLLLMDSARQNANIGSQWTNFSPAVADPAPLEGLQHYDLNNDFAATLQKDITADEDDVTIVGCRLRTAFDAQTAGSGTGGNDFIIRWIGSGVVHMTLKFTGRLLLTLFCLLLCTHFSIL